MSYYINSNRICVCAINSTKYTALSTANVLYSMFVSFKIDLLYLCYEYDIHYYEPKK